MIRLKLVLWNPLDENCLELDRMDWYAMTMKYGWSSDETEESLASDPDVRLIPVLIEKIILPKITGWFKRPFIHVRLHIYLILVLFFRNYRNMLGSPFVHANPKIGSGHGTTWTRISVAQDNVQIFAYSVFHRLGQDQGRSRQWCVYSYLPQTVSNWEYFVY